jgi:hypothetical protein
MFFVRIAFFVVLVLILLPGNTNEKAEFHRKISEIGSDVSTFCDRNGEVCEKTTGFFDTLYQKVVTTVEMLEDMLRGNRGNENNEQNPQNYQNGNQYNRRQRHGSGDDYGRSPTAAVIPYSQNTLTSADLRPSWNGPKPWPSQVAYGGKAR